MWRCCDGHSMPTGGGCGVAEGMVVLAECIWKLLWETVLRGL